MTAKSDIKCQYLTYTLPQVLLPHTERTAGQRLRSVAVSMAKTAEYSTELTLRGRVKTGEHHWRSGTFGTVSLVQSPPAGDKYGLTKNRLQVHGIWCTILRKNVVCLFCCLHTLYIVCTACVIVWSYRCTHTHTHTHARTHAQRSLYLAITFSSSSSSIKQVKDGSDKYNQ